MPSGYGDKIAENIGLELDRINKKYGYLKPSLVVDEARDQNSPIHDLFEWNNSKAAEKYRQQQASNIICSVRIVDDGRERESQPIVRAFVHVIAHENEKDFTGGGYIPMAKAQNDEDYRRQLLERAKGELRSWKKTYSDLEAHFAEIFNDVLK